MHKIRKELVIVYTSERAEARDLIRGKEGGIGEVLFEANCLIVAAIVEKLVKKLKSSEHVVLLQEEVHNAIAQRRSLHVHFPSFNFFEFAEIKTLIWSMCDCDLKPLKLKRRE